MSDGVGAAGGGGAVKEKTKENLHRVAVAARFKIACVGVRSWFLLNLAALWAWFPG